MSDKVSDDELFLEECINIARQRIIGPTLVDTKDLPDCNRYYGLPSNAICVYSTGDPWPKHTPREVRPITIHPIAPVWHKLGREIYKYYDSVKLMWMTLDLICFAKVSSKEVGPLYIWVGVMPGTLTSKDAEKATIRSKQLIANFQITGCYTWDRHTV